MFGLSQVLLPSYLRAYKYFNAGNDENGQELFTVEDRMFLLAWR